MKSRFRLVVKFSLLFVILPVLFLGALCKPDVPIPSAVKLTYWRVFDRQSDIQPYIDQFQTEFPYVKIEVRNFTLDEYQEALVSAWAKGEGPDLYSIPNYWLGKYVQYSAPLPSSLNLVKIATTSRLGRKETSVTQEKVTTLTEQLIHDRWIDAVADDVIFDGKIYGLPLATDTLAMYYNKDLLAQAGIAVPPTTWSEFIEDVPQISVINQEDEILRSGAALGTHENVDRYFDILSLLMMQNGATMADGNSSRFNYESEVRPGYYPGLAATQFYTDFANPKKNVYSWTAAQPDSLEAFTGGQTAFFFGYWYHLDQIKKRSPSLNFGVAAVPQIAIGQQVNFANYWVESVAKSGKHQELAWAFIQAMTKAPQQYLASTGRPAALRSIIATQQADPSLSIFADEALTAKTWYHGANPDQAEQIFADLIDAIRVGESDPLDTVDIASKQISETLPLSE